MERNEFEFEFVISMFSQIHRTEKQYKHNNSGWQIGSFLPIGLSWEGLARLPQNRHSEIATLVLECFSWFRGNTPNMCTEVQIQQSTKKLETYARQNDEKSHRFKANGTLLY